MKRQGPIWLGLTEDARSLRAYPAFADFGRMVARSAFAALRYSPLRLAGAIAGMGLTYLAPPLFALFAHGVAQSAGALAWAMMALEPCADAPPLRSAARRRPRCCPPIAVAYVVFMSNPPCNIGADAAATGRAAFRPRRGRRGAHDDCDRDALRQDPSRREFSRRVMAHERRHRGPILAFYRFARAADDVADHPYAFGGSEARAARRSRRRALRRRPAGIRKPNLCASPCASAASSPGTPSISLTRFGSTCARAATPIGPN